MVVGERFKKDGKTYEVTSVISDCNYGFKEVGEEPVFAPVIEDVEEVKEVKETKAKRGRKKA